MEKYTSLITVTVHDCSPVKSRFPFCGSNPVSKRYGHPRVLGIPIPKTLVIWTSPSHITLAIWVRVRVTGDAHITRVLGMGMTKTRGCPYHFDIGTLKTRRKLRRVNLRKDFWDCYLGQRKRLDNRGLKQKRF